MKRFLQTVVSFFLFEKIFFELNGKVSLFAKLCLPKQKRRYETTAVRKIGASAHLLTGFGCFLTRAASEFNTADASFHAKISERLGIIGKGR